MTNEPKTPARYAMDQRNLTQACQTLMGICAGIAADGSINDLEVRYLSTWLNEHPDVCSRWPGSEIARQVQEVLADGVITPEEKLSLHAALAHLTGNFFSETGSSEPEGPVLPLDDDPCIFFRDMSFCFTGEFLYGTRAACERAIMSRQGFVADAITKKLNYLVIGTLVSPDWFATTYGRKIQKAVEYRAAGVGLVIVSERQWSMAMADA